MLDTGNCKFFMFDEILYHSAKGFKAVSSLSLNNANPKTMAVVRCRSNFLSNIFLSMVNTLQKMKFSFKNSLTLTKEIFSRKLHFYALKLPFCSYCMKINRFFKYL